MSKNEDLIEVLNIMVDHNEKPEVEEELTREEKKQARCLKSSMEAAGLKAEEK